jgi:hypothetical protein
MNVNITLLTTITWIERRNGFATGETKEFPEDAPDA